jgi:hypothetical protein
VPLLLLHPSYRGTRRIKDYKSLIDIFPTALNMLEIPATSVVDGRSLFENASRTLLSSLFPLDAAAELQLYKLLRFPVGSLILTPKERQGLDPFKREQSFLDIYVNARTEAATGRPGCLDRDCRIVHTPGRLDHVMANRHSKKIDAQRARILDIIRGSIGCSGDAGNLSTYLDNTICLRFPDGAHLLKRRRTVHFAFIDGTRRESVDRFKSERYLADEKNRIRIEKLLPALGQLGSGRPRNALSSSSKKTIERLRALGYIQ